MTVCRVCGAPVRRARKVCAACGAELGSFQETSDAEAAEPIRIRRYGRVPPPAAHLHSPAPPRRLGRLAVLLLLGLAGAAGLVLALVRLLR